MSCSTSSNTPESVPWRIPSKPAHGGSHHAGQLLGIRQGQPLGNQFTHSDRQTGDQSRHETETQGRAVWGQLRKKGASIRLVCCLEKQSSSESKFPYSAISHYAIKDQVIQDGL
jgi:hypothetical protein